MQKKKNIGTFWKLLNVPVGDEVIQSRVLVLVLSHLVQHKVHQFAVHDALCYHCSIDGILKLLLLCWIYIMYCAYFWVNILVSISLFS